MTDQKTIIANRFLGPKKAITYTLSKTSDGYRVEAMIPKHLSSADKYKIVSWFRAYRNEVRRLNPFYSARFNSYENGYSLDIKPCKSYRPIDEDGERVKGILNDTLQHA